MSESGTPLQIGFDLLLYILGFLLLQKVQRKGVLVKGDFAYVFLIFFIFCLFPFWGGDYFGYKSDFSLIRTNEFTTLEDFYIFIAKSIPQSYLVFRLCIWGTAVFLLFKLFELNSEITAYAILFFFSLFLPWYSYARVSLAMVVMFLGGYFIITSYEGRFKINKFVLGVALLSVSFFLHRSAAYGILVIIVCLLFHRFKRKHIIAIILCFPAVIILFKTLISQFLLMGTEDMLIDAYTGQAYLNADKHVNGPGMIIGNALQSLVYYLCMFLIGKCIWSGKNKTFPKPIQFFSSASALIIVSASVFLFDLGANTGVLYNRFLFFSMIPSSLVLAYCYKEGIYKRFVRIVFRVGSFTAFYALLYAFYCSFFS